MWYKNLKEGDLAAAFIAAFRSGKIPHQAIWDVLDNPDSYKGKASDVTGRAIYTALQDYKAASAVLFDYDLWRDRSMSKADAAKRLAALAELDMTGQVAQDILNVPKLLEVVFVICLFIPVIGWIIDIFLERHLSQRDLLRRDVAGDDGAKARIEELAGATAEWQILNQPLAHPQELIALYKQGSVLPKEKLIARLRQCVRRCVDQFKSDKLTTDEKDVLLIALNALVADEQVRTSLFTGDDKLTAQEFIDLLVAVIGSSSGKDQKELFYGLCSDILDVTSNCISRAALEHACKGKNLRVLQNLPRSSVLYSKLFRPGSPRTLRDPQSDQLSGNSSANSSRRSSVEAVHFASTDEDESLSSSHDVSSTEALLAGTVEEEDLESLRLFILGQDVQNAGLVEDGLLALLEKPSVQDHDSSDDVYNCDSVKAYFDAIMKPVTKSQPPAFDDPLSSTSESDASSIHSSEIRGNTSYIINLWARLKETFPDLCAHPKFQEWYALPDEHQPTPTPVSEEARSASSSAAEGSPAEPSDHSGYSQPVDHNVLSERLSKLEHSSDAEEGTASHTSSGEPSPRARRHVLSGEIKVGEQGDFILPFDFASIECEPYPEQGPAIDQDMFGNLADRSPVVLGLFSPLQAPKAQPTSKQELNRRVAAYLLAGTNPDLMRAACQWVNTTHAYNAFSLKLGSLSGLLDGKFSCVNAGDGVGPTSFVMEADSIIVREPQLIQLKNDQGNVMAEFGILFETEVTKSGDQIELRPNTQLVFGDPIKLYFAVNEIIAQLDESAEFQKTFVYQIVQQPMFAAELLVRADSVEVMTKLLLDEQVRDVLLNHRSAAEYFLHHARHEVFWQVSDHGFGEFYTSVVIACAKVVQNSVEIQPASLKDVVDAAVDRKVSVDIDPSMRALLYKGVDHSASDEEPHFGPSPIGAYSKPVITGGSDTGVRHSATALVGDV